MPVAFATNGGPGTTTLALNGGLGNAKFNITPVAGVDITAESSGPATSNQAVVNGTSSTDTINVAPTAVGTATVQVGTLGLVTLNNTASLAINGQGGNDALTVTTPAGANNDTYTPGAAPDAGSFQVGNLTPISYSNLGLAGSVTLANAAAATDTLAVNGTAGNDTFGVASSGDITLNNQLVLHTPGVAALILNGLLGSDVFNVTGGSPFTSIKLNGDATANFTAATGAVGVALADSALNTNSVVSGYGPNVTLVGVDTANLDLSGGVALTANGHSSPNSFNYQPTGVNGGTFTDSGVATTFNFTDATSTFTIDGGAGGSNLVTVQGTSGDDTISAIVGANPANTQVTVNNSFEPVQIVTADTAGLAINGGAGNDVLSVLSTTAPVTIPITFDGGTGRNSLELSSGGPAGLAATSDTYTPGPQIGSGTDTLVFAGGTEVVNFLNLAPVLDIVPSAVQVVNGTPAANAINYTNAGSSGDGLITIDNQESIEFANKTNLTLNGQAGDDTINLNYQPFTIGSGPQVPVGLTSITVDAGDPTASDKLIVNGVSAELDNLVVTPTGPNAGNVTNLNPGFVPVRFANVENLSVVGQSGDGDTLQYAGTAGSDTFEYSPGRDPRQRHHHRFQHHHCEQLHICARTILRLWRGCRQWGVCAAGFRIRFRACGRNRYGHRRRRRGRKYHVQPAFRPGCPCGPAQRQLCPDRCGPDRQRDHASLARHRPE